MPNLTPVKLVPFPEPNGHQDKFENAIVNLGVLRGALTINTFENRYTNENVDWFWAVYKVNHQLS